MMDPNEELAAYTREAAPERECVGKAYNPRDVYDVARVALEEAHAECQEHGSGWKTGPIETCPKHGQEWATATAAPEQVGFALRAVAVAEAPSSKIDTDPRVYPDLGRAPPTQPTTHITVDALRTVVEEVASKAMAEAENRDNADDDEVKFAALGRAEGARDVLAAMTEKRAGSTPPTPASMLGEALELLGRAEALLLRARAASGASCFSPEYVKARVQDIRDWAGPLGAYAAKREADGNKVRE